VSVCPLTITRAFGGNGALVLTGVAGGTATDGGDGFGVAGLDETGRPAVLRLGVWPSEATAKSNSTNARRMVITLIGSLTTKGTLPGKLIIRELLLEDKYASGAASLSAAPRSRTYSR